MTEKFYSACKIVLIVTTILSGQCFGIDSYYYKNWYATPTSDTYLTTPKIIRRHGYPAEAHIIQSEDGYLLEYHRIPHAKNKTACTRKYPILLHHGLLGSSADWVINGPDRALAYRLADEGYDVWLANARGNSYSRSHISLNPSDRSFWDFSFHEAGVFDVPAAIDYILNVTSSEKLIYIGHSLGTTTFYAFATHRPEYSNKILIQISVAPVAAISHATSLFRLLVPIAKEIRSMTDWYYKGAFLEHDTLTSLFCKYICGRNMFDTNLCVQVIMFNLFGKDKEQFDNTLIPVITSHVPAGTSGKNMIHCSQLIGSSGKFRRYDYGVTENIKRYGSANPPIYKISDIKIPMKFYYSKNDILADPTDVEILYEQVSKPMGLTLIDDDNWNHIDFLWAIDINKFFNDELVEFLNNVTTNANFIMEAVEEALEKRLQRPAPANPPFDSTNFENNVAQLPGLTEAINEMNHTLKNDSKEDVENTIDDSRRNTGRRNFKEERLNASQQIDQKMKETLEKLALLYSNTSRV